MACATSGNNGKNKRMLREVKNCRLLSSVGYASAMKIYHLFEKFMLKTIEHNTFHAHNHLLLIIKSSNYCKTGYLFYSNAIFTNKS